jgi:hypothetical protein
MTQAAKAKRFGALHIPGQPLVLYNIWDAGGEDPPGLRRTRNCHQQLVDRSSPRIRRWRGDFS